MKKTFILLASCLMAFSGQAQVQKGAKLIGVGLGSISYSNTNYTTTYSNTPVIYDSEGTSFSVDLYPNMAWFLADNLAVGGTVDLGFYRSSSTSSNSGSAVTSEYTYVSPSVYLGPLVRYYFGNSAKGRPFAEIAGSIGMYFGSSKSSSSSGSSSETTSKPKGDWDATVAGGYEVFLSPNVGLYAKIGFSYGKDKTEYEYAPSTGTGYSYTQEYQGFYVPVSFGLQIHLVPKEK